MKIRTRGDGCRSEPGAGFAAAWILGLALFVRWGLMQWALPLSPIGSQIGVACSCLLAKKPISMAMRLAAVSASVLEVLCIVGILSDVGRDGIMAGSRCGFGWPLRWDRRIWPQEPPLGGAIHVWVASHYEVDWMSVAVDLSVGTMVAGFAVALGGRLPPRWGAAGLVTAVVVGCIAAAANTLTMLATYLAP